SANPRHEHEYHLFERVEVPEGKVLCPGVVTHASNIVEHPELIAERLIRFAKLIGRENVMAGADCGFSSQALYKTEGLSRWCGRSSRRCDKGPIWQQSSFGIERAQAQRRTSLWSSLRQPLSPDRARRVHGRLQLRALVRLAKRIAVDGLPFGIQKLVGFARACARAGHDLD